MTLKSWYDVIKPHGNVPEASEFAVHLDQVRYGRALDEYKNPEMMMFAEKALFTGNPIKRTQCHQ